MRHEVRQAAAHSSTRSSLKVRWLLVLAVLAAMVFGACTGQPGTVSEPGGTAPSSTAASGSSVIPAQPGASDQMSSETSEAPSEAPERTRRPRGPSLPPAAPLQPPAYASRVVIADLGIDLPVISGDLQPPPNYPFCDVAAYVTRFNQPYESGVTYISAHAQEGMFAPLLQASEVQDGESMLGMRVDVYTNDGRRFTYTIDRVVRHATDYAVINTVPLDQRTLILQTSEGPDGTVEKLQVLASFVEEVPVDIAEATPESRPRDCSPPDLGGPTATP